MCKHMHAPGPNSDVGDSAARGPQAGPAAAGGTVGTIIDGNYIDVNSIDRIPIGSVGSKFAC